MCFQAGSYAEHRWIVPVQGMLEGVLDVSWTCDQGAVLGAGNDKSIRLWDPLTGRVRHTMTGHTGKARQRPCTP